MKADEFKRPPHVPMTDKDKVPFVFADLETCCVHAAECKDLSCVSSFLN